MNPEDAWYAVEPLREKVTKQLFEEAKIKNLALMSPITPDLLNDAITVAAETIKQGLGTVEPLGYKLAYIPYDVRLDEWIKDARPKALAAVTAAIGDNYIFGFELSTERREAYITVQVRSS